MTSNAPVPSRSFDVTILMGVHNGALHLGEQLRSIAAQTCPHWNLICADDGSTDESRDILSEFQRQTPARVVLKDGPGRGFSANYMQMIATLPATAGFVAFADQDDIWLPGKIDRALAVLGQSSQPMLYCGRQVLWYPGQARPAITPARHRPAGLRNALIENIAHGNTIVLNPAAARLAQGAALRTGPVFAHDWWLYLLISACGGQVIHDNGPPLIHYRQHGGNAIGAGRGWRAQITRKKGVLRGVFAERVAGNLAALGAVDDQLTAEARQIIADFSKARACRTAGRLAGLQRIRPYRQNWRASLGFWGAASLGLV